jgi:L-lactate dehydrogenase complex protein LldE
MATEIIRPSPKNKTAALFVTCMVDSIYPNTGISTVRLLEHVGTPVEFPAAQTCCGQPAFNAGFWNDARPAARQFMHAFKDADLIITPSGSCASMVRHYYPQLFEDDPRLHREAVRMASITWELTEYLVDGLEITNLDGTLPATTVAFHHACHGLRLLDLSTQARTLVDHIDDVTVLDWPQGTECCGFGGLFAVKMPEVSGAMLQTKLRAIDTVNADVIITGDSGCLTQINGGLTRAGEPPQVVHIADFLAQSIE